MRGGRGSGRSSRGDSQGSSRGFRKVISQRPKDDSRSTPFESESRNSRGSVRGGRGGRGNSSAKNNNSGGSKFGNDRPLNKSRRPNSDDRKAHVKFDIEKSNKKYSSNDKKSEDRKMYQHRSKSSEKSEGDSDKPFKQGSKSSSKKSQSSEEYEKVVKFSDKKSKVSENSKVKKRDFKSPKGKSEQSEEAKEETVAENVEKATKSSKSLKSSKPSKDRPTTRATLASSLRTANDIASTQALEALSASLPSLSQYEMDALSQDASHLSGRWTNKQRVLCLGSRGMRTAHRFLLADFKSILPHHISDVKWEKKLPLDEMTETADLANCNNILYLETRRKRLLMWLAKSPNGPSAKFEVLNVQTSEGCNYIGNCLKYSRPIMIFDSWFDSLTQLKLIKELFIQIVGTPRYHPSSKPFHDHAISLFYNDGKIWFRHYQIFPTENKNQPIELREIGPRFCLEPIRIFTSAFGGKTLWKNPERFGLNPRPEGGENPSEEGIEVGQNPDIFSSSEDELNEEEEEE